MADGGGAKVEGLSGETVTFISKSGSKFPLEREIAEAASGLVKTLLKEAGPDAEGSEGTASGSDASGGAEPVSTEVPVRVVEDDTLVRAINFMKHHYTNPLAEVEKPLASNKIEDVVTDPFDRQFVDVGQAVLLALINAATFMEMDQMLELVVAKVATQIKGRTTEEVKEFFELDDDYTPEDEAKVHAENPWLAEM